MQKHVTLIVWWEIKGHNWIQTIHFIALSGKLNMGFNKFVIYANLKYYTMLFHFTKGEYLKILSQSR